MKNTGLGEQKKNDWLCLTKSTAKYFALDLFSLNSGLEKLFKLCCI